MATLGVASTLGASGALAATVTVREHSHTKVASTHTADFEAAAGERNDLTISRETAPGPKFDDVTFADAGAPVTARAGCVQVSPNEAFCDRGAIDVTLGDLDDHVLARAFAYVDGGQGSDLLEGAGSLDGGAGDDVIRGDDGDGAAIGGPGLDQVATGGGDDDIAAYPDGAPELFDGGAGSDTLNYFGRAVVDLVAGRAGVPGDEDRLQSIERAEVGSGRIRGDGGRNELRAEGRATLLGGGGADALTGLSDERDTIDGGSGDDRILLPGGEGGSAPDRLRCGPGRDYVEGPWANALVPIDCERVSFFMAPDIHLPGAAGAHGGLAQIRFVRRCAHDSTVKSCRMKATVSEAVWPDRAERPRSGRVLGTATGTISRRQRRLTVTPGRYGRAVLASGRCVTARLKMTGVGDDGDLEVLYRLGRGCRAPAPVEP
jgi:hypothetical protein